MDRQGAEKSLDIVSAPVDVVDDVEDVGNVSVKNGRGDPEHDLPIGHAQNAQHALVRDVPVRAGQDLVEQAQGVPDAALGLPGDEGEAFGRHRRSFPPAELVHMMGDVPGADPPEVMLLAARQDGDGDFVGLGGGEQKQDMVRRLLEGLQQRVERRRAEHVDLVDDIDLATAAGRHIPDVVAKVADMVDAVVRGPVDLENVDGTPGGDLQARGADVAGNRRRPLLAVHGFGKDTGDGGLARAAGTGKEDGVGDAVRTDGVCQGAGDVGLPDHILEGLRTVFSCENQIGHYHFPDFNRPVSLCPIEVWTFR